ncbi:MAG: hypothetical protein Nk1A_2300 [Endomicrobiia bacterium]|nr:MAG: hypothetical protein Nk1A_2300 [Endomicrobiia bacterium]
MKTGEKSTGRQLFDDTNIITDVTDHKGYNKQLCKAFRVDNSIYGTVSLGEG